MEEFTWEDKFYLRRSLETAIYHHRITLRNVSRQSLKIMYIAELTAYRNLKIKLK